MLTDPLVVDVDANSKMELDAGGQIGASVGTAGDCVVNATITKGRSGVNVPKSGDCKFTVTPIDGPAGTGFSTSQSGACDGLGVTLTFTPAAVQPARSASSLRPETLAAQWVDARTIAVDPVYFDMIIVSSQINFQYDGYTTVVPVSYPNYYHDDSWWYLVTSSEDYWSTLPNPPLVPYLTHYFYVHSHSDGFPTSGQPDIDAYIEPTAYAYASGGWSCSYYHEWYNASYYPNLRFQDWCDHYP